MIQDVKNGIVYSFPNLVEAVIVTRLDDLLAFADRIREYTSGSPS